MKTATTLQLKNHFLKITEKKTKTDKRITGTYPTSRIEVEVYFDGRIRGKDVQRGHEARDARKSRAL